MMRPRLLSTTLALVALLASAHAQASSDLDQLVRERAQAAGSLEIDSLWREAQVLVEAADTIDPEALAPVLDRWLRGDAPPTGAALLFVASARLAVFEPDVELLAQRLRPELTSPDPDIAAGAAGLFGEAEFRDLPGDERSTVVEALSTTAEDAQRDARVRLASAVAATLLGRNEEQRRARRVLVDLASSDDQNVRGHAALALAQIGDLETARGELERLSRVPGTEGELAAAFLKQEELRDTYEERIRTYLRRIKENSDLELSGSPEDVRRLESLMRLIEDDYLEGDRAKRDDLISAGLDAMLRSLDEHSSYLRPEFFKDFDQDLQGEYGGIGAYVAEDRNDQLFTITRPIYSGPAYKAGLQTDDKIVKIDDWSTVGEDVDDIIKRLKGRPGTAVKLYVWRRGMDEELIENPTEDMAVVVERAQIVIPPVQHQMMPGGVGLVELTTFSRVASRELALALDDLLANGARAIILDLRNNSGGLLSEARNVADLFLPKGQEVVRTESRVEDTEILTTRRAAQVPASVPVAVLVNRFSASASEIVSGALQDHKRALIVGRRSFGKGSVQKLYPVDRDDDWDDDNKNRRFDNWETITRDWNGNGEFDFAPRVKLTMARYLLPSGRSIHHEFDENGNEKTRGGVEPDVDVEVARREQWRLEGMLRINRDSTIREWVADRYPENAELFERLAVCDQRDPSLYPGFDELYESLNTNVPKDDVRFLLRREVRRKVQDRRERAFPAGDFEEDAQVQMAITKLMGELGDTPDRIPEYRTTFDLDGAAALAQRVAAQPESPGVALVQDVLTDIQEARRDDGKLSKENLRRLKEILAAALGS